MRTIVVVLVMCSFAVGFALCDIVNRGKLHNLPMFSETKYVLMTHAQLIFDKNTLWDDFTIQEKMFLCAYGSSGNKLDNKEIGEIQDLYGVK